MNNQLINLKASRGILTIAAKNHGDVSLNDIQLKVLWGHCWWHELPLLETFLEVLELTLKRAVSAVMEHDELFIDYTIRTNDSLELFTEVEIIFNEVSADGTEFDVSGDLLLRSEDSRGILTRMTAFRRRLEDNIQIAL